MIHDINQNETDKSNISSDTPAINMNSNFEWEYDPSVNPSTIFAKIRIIGQGSFGTVAEILHSPSMTILAGKLINQKFLENDKSKNELTNEIDHLCKISSPYTIRYFGTVPLEDSLMILMEYCDRCSLRNILDARQQVLSEDQISFVMHDLLKGLEIIHNNYQMVHRDIKSANILLNSNGEIKISDFDISKIFESDSFQNMTIIGAPYWMAPEVVSGISYNYEADIWSVGITAVELCEGAPPFAELDPTKAMIEIAIKGFPGYRFPSMHSPELCDFISHCVETDPKKRWKINQLLEHPFIKRSENLDKYETLQNIIEKDQTQTNNTIKSISSSNSIYSSINYNDANSKANLDNYGTLTTFDELDLNPELQAQLQAGKQDLPNGHNFVRQRINGNSFEGMAMIMSQQFDNGNFDSFNSGSFNASMSDFGNFSDDDPFKPDNNIVNQKVGNYDSMSDFNIPFGELSGTDSLNFGTFQQQQNQQQQPHQQISSSEDFIKNQQNDVTHSTPLMISHQPPNSSTIGISPQNSSSIFNFLPNKNSNLTLNQSRKRTEIEYQNPTSLKQRSNNMKNVPDKLFVEVSRAISTKIPFVPFSSPQFVEEPSSKDKNKNKKKKQESQESVDDDDSIDNKIKKIRDKLTRSPPLIALTIFLLFFFIFGFEAVLPLCGLLIVISLILKHLKHMKKIKKDENKEKNEPQK